MGPTLEHLRGASATEAGTWFAGVDADELVAAVRATGDDALLEVLGRPEVLAPAVAGVLQRLHEYAVPERLALVHGTVRIDLRLDLRLDRGRRTVVAQRHALAIDHGRIKVLLDVDAGEPADVVLATSVLRFVRLVSGEANAGLDYLGGALDISGDADLALALGAIFRVPGSTDVAVDPRALDPVDVATVLGTVSPEHLRSVMASGFRPVVLDEVFRRLPDFLDLRRAVGVDLTVGFRLLGRPDGGIDRYVVRVADGVATVLSDADEVAATEATRDATVTCSAADFLRLATGHLSAVSGVLRGQLKVRGDRTKALRLASVMSIPQGR